MFTISTVADTDQLIADHLASAYTDGEVAQLAAHYQTHGYVKVNRLVPEQVFASVKEEVLRLLDDHARRIDIHLRETGNSPRFMSTVSQQAIARDGNVIPRVYDSNSLKGFLSRLAGEAVHECPWEQEKFVIIRQEKVGDTHGWHWGDFSFTVIWLLEVPPADFGGTLQCVPHTHWDKQNPRVEEWLATRDVESWDHVTGDLYFLRSDTTLHRTIPLNRPATRIILNTCWGSLSDTSKAQTHETMQAMFD